MDTKAARLTHKTRAGRLRWNIRSDYERCYGWRSGCDIICHLRYWIRGEVLLVLVTEAVRYLRMASVFPTRHKMLMWADIGISQIDWYLCMCAQAFFIFLQKIMQKQMLGVDHNYKIPTEVHCLSALMSFLTCKNILPLLHTYLYHMCLITIFEGLLQKMLVCVCGAGNF